jgi:hypothetical protein
MSASSAAFLIAAVAYHRLVFSRRLKPRLVVVTHRCAMAGLALGPGASAAASGVALLFVTIWFAVPMYERKQHRPDAGSPT